MSGLGPVNGWERAVVDGEHGLLESRSAAPLALMGAAVISAGTQRRTPMRCQSRRSQET